MPDTAHQSKPWLIKGKLLYLNWRTIRLFKHCHETHHLKVAKRASVSRHSLEELYAFHYANKRFSPEVYTCMKRHSGSLKTKWNRALTVLNETSTHPPNKAFKVTRAATLQHNRTRTSAVHHIKKTRGSAARHKRRSEQKHNGQANI